MVKKIILFLTHFLILALSAVSSCLTVGAENFEISAPCAVLMEPVSKKILFEKNSNEQRNAASVMKIMELLCTMEQISNGATTENSRVIISDAAADAKGANVWLKENETLTVAELMKAIAMVSANDASVALAEHLFGTTEKCVENMNLRARELGLKNTKFTGLEITDESQELTSAADLAAITAELIKYKNVFDYSRNWIDTIRSGKTQIVNTNRLVKTCDGVIGIKTGTNKNAGSCISAVAQRNGMTMIAVILGAESVKERDKSAVSLLDYGFSNFKRFTPKLPENFPKTVKIADGMQNEVAINADIKNEIFLPNSKNIEEAPEIRINDEISAPIKRGDVLGKVVYKSGNDMLAEYDIKASENVEKVGFKPMFMIFLKKFFAI